MLENYDMSFMLYVDFISLYILLASVSFKNFHFSIDFAEFFLHSEKSKINGIHLKKIMIWECS